MHASFNVEILLLRICMMDILLYVEKTQRKMFHAILFVISETP
jgi:hypothetical protein